jgi:2-amino-4-hydroxy-6-hydroxymethyldihydropteridine diphosphokinase/dihydropteroate synthase
MQLTLALGSNLGNRLKNIEQAMSALDFIKEPHHTCIRETAPLLLPNSPLEWNKPFLNALVIGECTYQPREVLARIKEIEKEMGRDLTAPRWSPRIIDIDILMYGDLTYQDDKLIIPHLELKQRSFWQDLLKEI